MKRSLLFISLFLLICLISSCGNSKQTNYPEGYEPTQITQDILDQMKKNNLNGPDSIVYPSVVSSLLYQGQNKAGNEFAKHTLITLGTVSAEVYHELSVQNLKNGNYAEAYKYISKAVELNPKEYAGYFGWVLIYYYRDYKKALEYLQLYDEFTPNFSDFPSGENIHYLFGLAQMKLGDRENALLEFNKYIDEETAIDAESFIDLAVFVHKGRIYENLGRNPEAIDTYTKAIELNERCVEAYYLLADLQYRLNNFEEASIQIEKAEDFFTNFRAQDVYIELFHEVYMEDILSLKNRINSQLDND